MHAKDVSLKVKDNSCNCVSDVPVQWPVLLQHPEEWVAEGDLPESASPAQLSSGVYRFISAVEQNSMHIQYNTIEFPVQKSYEITSVPSDVDKTFQPSICSLQVTQAMIRDGGASYSLTCLRCLLQLHCLYTADSASIQLSVYYLHRLKCFRRSDFPLVFWTKVYLISVCPPCWWEVVLSLQGTSAVSNVLSRNNWVYSLSHTAILYRPLSIPVKPIYQNKPPPLQYKIQYDAFQIHG